MYRFLPLLLLLFACASDPLELHVAEVKWTETDDGLNTVDLPDSGRITETTELLALHEDLNLKFSFRTVTGTQAKLLLQGKYVIELPSLAVTGSKPRITTAVSPGVWQDLEVVFIASDGESPAIMPAVYLNGALIYYQQAFAANDAPAGPLTLVVDSGEVEITALRYSFQGGKTSTIDQEGVSLNIPLLRYEYFELADDPVGLNDWAQTPAVKTGYINRFDLGAIRERGNSYAIRFTGKLQIPKKGEYTISTFTPAFVRVFIDERKIINDFDENTGARKVDGSIELSEGLHDFRLEYVQPGGWGVLKLSYKAPDEMAEKLLNSMGGSKVIATPGAANPQKLETDNYPYLLRSFLFFPAPRVYEAAAKRTHVISVGENNGPHYSIDLQNGALLQMWRGEFADTHDMWAGRGEPQVMRPLGAAIGFDGSPQWATISDDADRWPDSIPVANSADFRHIRHTLDVDGRPTFEYDLRGGHSVADKLSPDKGGLVRKLVHGAGGNSTLFTQLAVAAEITEVAPGEYALRGPGLKLKIKSYDGDRLVLQRAGGKDRLLAELPTNGQVTYRLDW